MDQTLTGKFIALKRREKNLTQEQLAEKLGISNKTISKWENGKCMPDYSIVKPLCLELGVTVAELMDGKVREAGDMDNTHIFDEQQMIDLLERVQRLEVQRQSLYGIMLMVMGVAMMALSHFFGGTNFQDFISGLMLGLAIGEILVGVYVTMRAYGKKS